MILPLSTLKAYPSEIFGKKGMNAMSDGLVLVDIQNDYFKGGKMALEGSHEAAEAACLLLSYFRKNGMPLAHIQHVAGHAGATFFIPNTPGTEIHASVKPLETETVIQKHFPNSFRQTGLLAHLQQKGVRRLVIAGMMTHMCVDATARAATDLGFQCLIAQDGCATRSLKFQDRIIPAEDVHGAFLAALNGAYGRVMSVDQIIKEIEKR
jgi:nicotinamidase-related amidase